MNEGIIRLLNKAIEVATEKIKAQNKEIDELKAENRRLGFIIEKFALKQLSE